MYGTSVAILAQGDRLRGLHLRRRGGQVRPHPGRGPGRLGLPGQRPQVAEAQSGPLASPTAESSSPGRPWHGLLLWDQLHQDPLARMVAELLRPSLAFVGVAPGCGPSIAHCLLYVVNLNKRMQTCGRHCFQYSAATSWYLLCLRCAQEALGSISAHRL